jgi:glycosyltransferase involved in cell wall biosynthesis
MSAEEPKISVCIPTYNQARYLAEAIESVLQQTFQDFEIILFDDASTDDTFRVACGFGDPRLRYHRQPQNVGIAGNRNSCLDVARGQYIAWLDSDDVYYPEMLALQSAVLDLHPSVGLVHGAYQVIDSEGGALPDWQLPFAHDVIEHGKDAFRELILSNHVAAPTVMVRRACYDKVGGYYDLGRSSTDWEMWLRIVLHTDVAYTAKVVAKYRYHENSISARTTRSGERLRCDIKVIKRMFSLYRSQIPDVETLERKAKAALATKALILSGDAFTLGSRLTALHAAVKGLSVFPSLSRMKPSWLLLSLPTLEGITRLALQGT